MPSRMIGSAIAPLRILAQTSCATAKIVWALSSRFPYGFQPSESYLSALTIPSGVNAAPDRRTSRICALCRRIFSGSA
jgi:hypothetical protein